MVCSLVFAILAMRLLNFVRPSIVVSVNIFGIMFWGSMSSVLIFLDVIFNPWRIFVLVGQ